MVTTTRLEQIEDEGSATLKLDDGYLVVRGKMEFRPAELRYSWRLMVEDFAFVAEVRTVLLPGGSVMTYNTGVATPVPGLMGCVLSRDDAEQLLRGEVPLVLTEARIEHDALQARCREIIAENHASWLSAQPREAVRREIERVVEDVPLRAKRKVLR